MNHVLLRFKRNPGEGPAPLVLRERLLHYLHSPLSPALDLQDFEQNFRDCQQLLGEDQHQLWIFWPARNLSPALGENQVIFEDEDFIAVDKPQGLASHSTNKKLTANAYDSVRGLLFKRNPLVLPYLGLLHRLDRDTSGVMLMTKTEKYNRALARQFEARRIKKLYLAASTATTPCEFQEQLIEKRLKRVKDPAKGFRTVVDPSGDEAQSLIHNLGFEKGLRHFAIELKTGRTHQIRVHLASIGFPIKGDSLYGDGVQGEDFYLHAHRLSFYHPGQKSILNLQAAPPTHLQITASQLSPAFQGPIY